MKKNPEENGWDPKDQQLLEQGLKAFPASLGAKERF
jgi:hypothetical protein